MSTAIASVLAATDASATSAPKAPVSQEDADTILAALRKIYDVTRNVGEALPVWEKCGSKEFEALAGRGLRMLQEKSRFEREQRRLAYMAKLQGIFATHMNAAREEKKAYDALPATLRAKLGAFPDTVKVPVSEVMGIFGEGLTEEQVVHNLTNLSFKVGKGRERNAPSYIVLDFKPAKVEAPTTTDTPPAS